MAGDWIKIETTLPEKPEVWQIAESLDLDPDTVVGKLVRVFSWFDGQTENGNAPSVTEKLIDRLVCVTGFTEAMAKAGWLVRNGDEISLKNFSRHNGNPAKTRAQGQRRQAKHRNAQSVTKASPEKRREEKNNTQGRRPPTPREKEAKMKQSTRSRTINEDLTDGSWAEG